MGAGLSEDQAFSARELSGLGFSRERIAALLQVDLEAVRAWWDGPAEPDAAVVEEASAVEPVAEPAVPSWPPPPDGDTEWSTVQVRGQWPHSETVRVRAVRLWGRDGVKINAAGEVWCPSCLRFRTVEELAAPFNHCPVGLSWPEMQPYPWSDDGPPADDDRMVPLVW